MTFTARMRERAAVLLARHGSSGTYTSTTGIDTTVTAVVRREHPPEPPDFLGQVRSQRVVADLLSAEIGPGSNIHRGDTLSVDGVNYTVDRLESDDGVRLRIVVTEDPL